MSLSIAVDVVVHIEGNVVEETDLLVVGVDVTDGVTVFVVIVLTVIRVIDDGCSREIFNEPLDVVFILNALLEVLAVLLAEGDLADLGWLVDGAVHLEHERSIGHLRAAEEAAETAVGGGDLVGLADRKRVVIDGELGSGREDRVDRYFNRFVLVVLCRLPKSGSGRQADQKEKSKRNKLHIVRK